MLKNKIKKIDLVNSLSSSTGYSKVFSNKVISDLINIIIQNIKLDNFKLKNIGSFKIIHKKERIGRNPITKEEFKVSSRKSLSFKASKKILLNLDKLL